MFAQSLLQSWQLKAGWAQMICRHPNKCSWGGMRFHLTLTECAEGVGLNVTLLTMKYTPGRRLTQWRAMNSSLCQWLQENNLTQQNTNSSSWIQDRLTWETSKFAPKIFARALMIPSRPPAATRCTTGTSNPNVSGFLSSWTKHLWKVQTHLYLYHSKDFFSSISPTGRARELQDLSKNAESFDFNAPALGWVASWQT